MGKAYQDEQRRLRDERERGARIEALLTEIRDLLRALAAPPQRPATGEGGGTP